MLFVSAVAGETGRTLVTKGRAFAGAALSAANRVVVYGLRKAIAWAATR